MKLKRYKSIFRIQENLISKGKFLKKTKDHWVISFPYNFGDLKKIANDETGGAYSNTAEQISDELENLVKKEITLYTAEKVGNKIELEFGTI